NLALRNGGHRLRADGWRKPWLREGAVRGGKRSHPRRGDRRHRRRRADPAPGAGDDARPRSGQAAYHLSRAFLPRGSAASSRAPTPALGGAWMVARTVGALPSLAPGGLRGLWQRLTVCEKIGSSRSGGNRASGFVMVTIAWTSGAFQGA